MVREYRISPQGQAVIRNIILERQLLEQTALTPKPQIKIPPSHVFGNPCNCPQCAVNRPSLFKTATGRQIMLKQREQEVEATE